MLRKIIPALCLLVLAGVLSCSDTEVKPKNEPPSISAPPRSIDVYARLTKVLCTETAGVYVRINSGSWTLVNTVATASCSNIGSFSASDGDFIQFTVKEATNPFNQTSEYRATTGSSCRKSGPTYCGDETFGTIYSFTLVSTVSSFAIYVSEDPITSGPSCSDLYIC